jgi:ATP-dependent Clp protease ATP-binding subunit ClpA
VRPENLLVGLVRGGGPPLYFLKEAGRLDVERFYADFAERLAPLQDDAGREQLPMHADAHAAVEMAVAFAAERRADEVYGLHLLHALTREGHGAVAQLLSAFGVDPAHVNAQLALSL